MDAIVQRRSIRKFTNKTVNETQIQEFLRAAMHAPSAGNQQPWHFIVVRGRDKCAQLMHCSPHASMLKDANVAVVVCADLDLVKHEGFWVQDCAAATQNMLIKIHELGLGAVWIGIYPVEERVKFLKEYFSLSSQIIPFCVTAIGYPAEKKEYRERFNAQRIHFDHW